MKDKRYSSRNRCLKVVFALIALIYTSLQTSATDTSFDLPPRQNNVLSLKEFCDSIERLSFECRDSVTIDQIRRGNMPSHLSRAVVITDTLTDALGNIHAVSLAVSRDVMAIGSDTDYLLIPVLPLTAQRIVNIFDASLPTRKISDLIHRRATVKTTPHPMTPDSTMSTIPVYLRYDSIVRAHYRSGDFVAGHKKDIVITNRIGEDPSRMYIYGWHYPDGRAIQPLSGAHNLYHVDYSHGIRLVSNTVIVDGRQQRLKDILADPVLFTLLSDEASPMTVSSYPLP